MTNKLLDGVAALPDGDKAVVKGFVAMAVLSLGIGVFFGFLSAFARADFLQFDAITAFRILTLHGVTIFFYWLYFLQAGAVLILAAVYTDGAGRIAFRRWAWTGLAFMVAGFIFSELAPALGSALLYNAPPELVEGDTTLAGLFYLGYLLLGFGLGLVAISAVATALKPKFDGKIDTWSSVSFAAVAWAGLLMVSAVASTNAFLPATLWAFGLGGEPLSYTMSWSILFHNVHYLPLMATVVIWYVMVEALAGVRSIFG
jgi:cytochrome c oxidase subunit 1